MKITKSYIASLLLLGAAFTACDEELDRPPVIVPEATIEANTSILEVKNSYWNENRNYIDTIGVNENGEHVVIAGRVISSDETGNIYKNIVIQDGTAALAISINEKDMFETYRIGQEVVIDLTDMYIGKYNGLQQLGYPEYSASYGWEATFMEMEFFKQHAQYNGLPKPLEVDTFTVDIQHLKSIKSNADSLQKWQSQLVRFDNVQWVEAGKPYSDPSASTSRQIKDLLGNKITVRNSSYATFHDKILPSDTGSVVGILSYYGSDWQVLLRSTDDCIGFDETTTPNTPNTPSEGVGDGSETTPYNIAAVIDGATGSGVWVEGYIVGWVDGASIDEGAHFSVPSTSASNLLLSDNPNTKAVEECIPIQLVSGTAARSALNLKDNPGNLGKKVALKGNLAKYFGTNGVKETSEYKIDEAENDSIVTPPTSATGDGSQSAPFSIADMQGGATGTGVWVAGYIVGWVDGADYENGSKFTVPATVASNILLSDNPNAKSVAECIPVQLVSGSTVRSALNLMDNPGNLGKKVSIKGNITTYFRVNGLKETTEYILDGDTGGTIPSTPAQTSTYKKASSITSGKEYILVASGKAATALTSGYGYLKVVDVTDNNGTIEVASTSGFVFTSTNGGYTIKDANGKYMYMKDDYNSFNVDTTLPVDGGVWTIAPQADGSMIITNVAKNKSIQYDAQYTSYGVYPDVRGVYPTLYEKIN